MGEKYTSQKELAERLDCSTSTINKAIKASVKLKGWMARGSKRSPKAQSFNEVVADNAVDLREADPAVTGLPDDEIDRIMASLIEQAKPDELAKLNELNEEGRREMAKLYMEQQQDKHIEDKAVMGNRILGRKP